MKTKSDKEIDEQPFSAEKRWRKIKLIKIISRYDDLPSFLKSILLSEIDKLMNQEVKATRKAVLSEVSSAEESSRQQTAKEILNAVQANLVWSDYNFKAFRKIKKKYLSDNPFLRKSVGGKTGKEHTVMGSSLSFGKSDKAKEVQKK